MLDGRALGHGPECKVRGARRPAAAVVARRSVDVADAGAAVRHRAAAHRRRRDGRADGGQRPMAAAETRPARRPRRPVAGQRDRRGLPREAFSADDDASGRGGRVARRLRGRDVQLSARLICSDGRARRKRFVTG